MLPLLFLSSAIAGRLKCPEGQTQLHPRADVCCWEGQLWDNEARRCLGEPTTCPSGLMAMGVLGNRAPRDGECLPPDQLDAVFGSAKLNTDHKGTHGGLIEAVATQPGSGGVEAGGGQGAVSPTSIGDSQATTPPGTPVAAGAGLWPGQDALILGSFERAGLNRVVTDEIDTLAACVGGLAAEGWPRTGEVVVKFVVDKDGAVSQSSLKSTTLKHPPTETCLVEAFTKLHFPAPEGGGIAIISYPFWVKPAE